MGNIKKGQTPRRIAAAILGTNLFLNAINIGELSSSADFSYTPEEWRKIEKAAAKIVAPMVKRLERIAGEVGYHDLAE